MNYLHLFKKADLRRSSFYNYYIRFLQTKDKNIYLKSNDVASSRFDCRALPTSSSFFTRPCTNGQEVQFGAHFRRSVAQLRRHRGFLEGGFGQRHDFTAAVRVERINSANLWTKERGAIYEKRKQGKRERDATKKRENEGA